MDTTLRPADDERLIAACVVDEAIEWYVRMASGLHAECDQAAFEKWRAADPDHARAWQRLNAMGGRVQAGRGQMPPPAMRKTLALAETQLRTRRRVLKTLMLGGAGATAFYVLDDGPSWTHSWTIALADIHTATGERRVVVLDDGTRLTLNTATGVDVRYDAARRRIDLRSGEIMVATAPDAAGRPFVVVTAEGTLTPVGTKFTVRRTGNDDTTRLAVTEGTVEVRVATAPTASPLLVHAGQQARFTRTIAVGPSPLDQTQTSWVDGILTAERMRLGDFLAELARYRVGHLGCDPAAADLRITGAWPIDGADATDRVLASLENTLPVKASRLTRYWVTVRPS